MNKRIPDRRLKDEIRRQTEAAQRLHTEGEERIFNTFHIYGIKVDVPTLKTLGLKAEDIT